LIQLRVRRSPEVGFSGLPFLFQLRKFFWVEKGGVL